MQDLIARPPTCTVQAPHRPMPQPNLVPVRPISSRITQSRGELSSASTVTGLPLIVKWIMASCILYSFVTISGSTERCDLFCQFRPGCLACPGCADIRGDLGDIEVAEPCGECRHELGGCSLPRIYTE